MFFTMDKPINNADYELKPKFNHQKPQEYSYDMSSMNISK